MKTANYIFRPLGLLSDLRSAQARFFRNSGLLGGSCHAAFMRQHRFMRCFFLGIILLFALLSCSRSEPKIVFGFIELVYYQDEGKPVERFSFFILPEDEDGIENLDELFLYHDREQLRWHLTSNDWITYTHNDKTWIGSRSISAVGDEPLPRGQYRAVLVNKGGERSERNFSFDAPEELRYPFPSLQMSEGRYTVTSAYPSNRLVCYDERGGFFSIINLTTLTGTVSSLELPRNVRSVALWAEDAQYFTSAFTNVVPVSH